MKSNASRKTGRVLLTLILIFLVCGMLLPTVLTAVGSFMPQVEITDHYGAVFSALSQGGAYIEEDTSVTLIPKNVTPIQYVVILLQTPEYLQRFWNAVLLVVPIVLGQVTVAAMAAYSLYRCRSRLRSVIFFAYVIIMLLPYQVTLLPNYLVADWLGTLGSRWAILLPDIFAPFSVFLLTRFMRRIPTAQLEAAALDGAGEGRLFLNICLPRCKSILWAVAILIFVDYWNMIEQPMILLEDSSQYPLSVYLSNINAEETGIAFAVATLYMVPSLLLFFYGQRHFVAGLGVGVAEEPRGGRVRRFCRRWLLPAVAVVFFTVLGLLWRFADTINPRFTPEVTLTVPLPGAVGEEEYSLVLPAMAVHEDDYGQYVLIAKEKTRDGEPVYQTRRVDVAVLARDKQTNTVAVAGNLSSLDNIIESYTTLPEANQYVTLVEQTSLTKTDAETT